MPDCRDCGHEMSLSRCWRLTCPSNGAKESALLVRDDGSVVEVIRGPLVLTKAGEERVKRYCADAARRVCRSNLFDPEPPEKALAHTVFALPISCSTGLFDDWLGGDDDDA